MWVCLDQVLEKLQKCLKLTENGVLVHPSNLLRIYQSIRPANRIIRDRDKKKGMHLVGTPPYDCVHSVQPKTANHLDRFRPLELA